jgi:hypothetical protein
MRIDSSFERTTSQLAVVEHRQQPRAAERGATGAGPRRCAGRAGHGGLEIYNSVFGNLAENE